MLQERVTYKRRLSYAHVVFISIDVLSHTSVQCLIILPSDMIPLSFFLTFIQMTSLWSVGCPDIRNRYADGSWETFNALLDNTPPLNGE